MAIKVVKNLVSPRKYYIKCPYVMKPTRIVVHNTYNNASARNEINYMINNNGECSFHFAVDDKEVVQGIPLNRNAWHAGDGFGKGNMEGIGIEICYSLTGGQRFIKAEKLAAKFIAQLLKERGWGIGRVTKHQDYMDKYCPHRTLDMGWERFLKMVKKELAALNKPSISSLKEKTKKRFGFTDGTIAYLSSHSNPRSLFTKLVTEGKDKVYTEIKDLKKMKKNTKVRFGFTDNTINFLAKHTNPTALFKKLSTKK